MQMEFHSIDSLSITECCEQLNISREDLPDALCDLNEPDKTTHLIVAQLRSLLSKDKEAFETCGTIEEFEAYLASWPDGLYLDEAVRKVAEFKAAEEDVAQYKKNKDHISGLETYIKKYPNGIFANEAKSALSRKKEARKIRNTLLLVIAIAIAIVVSLRNYSSVSYLDVPGDMSFGKRGGGKTVSIFTDADDVNIEVIESSDWITVDRDNDSLLIKAELNAEGKRIASITVNTYSSFFGMQFNCISKTIEITQESGLPTYLKVSQASVSFDKYGNSSSNYVTAYTDGCELLISTDDSWLTVSKNIRQDGETMVASVTLNADANDEGDKTGVVIVSCNDYVKRIYVSQESGLATYFNIEKSSLTMAEEGNSEGMCYPINVYTDGTSWSVKESPSWLTTRVARNRLEISVGVNEGEVKTGTIILMSNSGAQQEISVTQQGKPTDFRAARSIVKFGTFKDYEYITIYNDSHKNLSVSEDRYWITASVINQNEIKISCDRNYSEPPRSGTVYVNCGDEQVSITVGQDGWVDCSNCGGDGDVNCPNLYAYPWANELGYFFYCWVDGQHVLRRSYTSWTGWMGAPVPQVEDRICSDCGGDGRVECSECGGNGKIKKSY